ncbi:hypothetical protein D9M68_189630 [compost metagenome]
MPTSMRHHYNYTFLDFGIHLSFDAPSHYIEKNNFINKALHAVLFSVNVTFILIFGQNKFCAKTIIQLHHPHKYP